MSIIPIPIAGVFNKGAEVLSTGVTEFKSEFTTQLPSLITSGLILVVSLSWNDSIQGLINYYIPEKYKGVHNAWFKILYSAILTIVIVIIIIILTHIGKHTKELIK